MKLSLPSILVTMFSFCSLALPAFALTSEEIREFQNKVKEQSFIRSNVISDDSEVKPDGSVLLKNVRYQFNEKTYEIRQGTGLQSWGRTDGDMVCKLIGFQGERYSLTSTKVASAQEGIAFIDQSTPIVIKTNRVNRVLVNLSCF